MISIVGAGPAGCIAAINAAKKSDTVVYDSQGRGHRRIQCSGLLSRTGLLELGIDPMTDSSKSIVMNTVRGARIYSPKGLVLEVDGGKNKAFVLDRRELDNHLIDKAADAGAKIVKETIDAKRIREIRGKSERTILATGTNYGLHKALGIPHPKKHLIGAQYEMKIGCCDSEYVEMYLSVPGFFSWIIPAGDNARIGLCTTSNPTPYLEGFIKRLTLENRIKDQKILDRNYGIIPIYEPKNKAQHRDVRLVGDAAGHVKATTGGGIILGGLAAQYACEDDYEKKWRKEVGRELSLHLLIRKTLARLSEDRTDRLIQLLSEKRKTIETAGDMDKASNLAVNLAKDPLFMGKLLIQFPGIVYDILNPQTVI